MKILKKQILFMYGAKVITLASTLISTPIGLTYFGVEKYGLLALTWTLLTFLNLSNFGLPFALKSYLAVYRQKSNRVKVILIILKLYFPICVVLLSLLYFVDKGNLQVIIGNNVPDHLQKIMANTLFIAALLFIINLPLSTFLEGFSGIQKIHYSMVYEVFISLTILISMLVVVNKSLGLYDFFLIRGVLNLIINALGFIHFLHSTNKTKNTNDDKSVANFSLNHTSIINMSLLHFFSGISALLVWHTDNLIIARMFSLGEVGVYSLNFRLVTTCFILFTTISAVYNPMFGKDYGENNILKITSNFRFCLLITTIISTSVAIFAPLFGEGIMDLWLSKPEYFDIRVVVSLCAYGMVVSVTHTSVALATATGSIKKLPIIGLCEAAVNLVASLIFGAYLGVYGVALGTFFAALVTAFWLVPFLCVRLIWKDVWVLYGLALKHFLYINFPLVLGLLILIPLFQDSGFFLIFKFIILIFFISINGFFIFKELNRTIINRSGLV